MQGGVTTNLGTSTLSSGNYNGFRLVLDTQKSTVTLKDGTVLSGGSGIKPALVTGGLTVASGAALTGQVIVVNP